MAAPPNFAPRELQVLGELNAIVRYGSLRGSRVVCDKQSGVSCVHKEHANLIRCLYKHRDGVLAKRAKELRGVNAGRWNVLYYQLRLKLGIRC